MTNPATYNDAKRKTSGPLVAANSDMASMDKSATATDDAHMAELLGLNQRPTFGKRLFRWIVLVVALSSTAAFFVMRHADDNSYSEQYLVEELPTGNLQVTVTATGTLELTNVIEIGSELSGTIRELHADFNDRVGAGQILAPIDTDQLEATVAQKKALVVAGEAAVAEADATLLEARLHYNRSETAGKRSGIEGRLRRCTGGAGRCRCKA